MPREPGWAPCAPAGCMTVADADCAVKTGKVMQTKAKAQSCFVNQASQYLSALRPIATVSGHL
jgi:hypothetical protein